MKSRLTGAEHSFDKSKPYFLSFFSGALGLDVGIERAGFHGVLYCENDPTAQKTIRANRPGVPVLPDVLDCTAESIRKLLSLSRRDEIPLIVGGPPCQAFSTAGKRQSFSDPRGNVFLKYIDLCLELKPRYFIVENVRGLLSAALQHRPQELRGRGHPKLKQSEMPGSALKLVLNKIRAAGYGVSYNLYNAANFGVPQIRERIIMVCSRDGSEAPFLEPTHSESEEHGLPVWRDLQSALKGLENCAHEHVNFPEKRLKYYRLLNGGENWRDLPAHLQKEAMGKSFFSGGGKTGFYRRLSWNDPAPTLVTHPAMPATDLCHPKEDRPLSVQEYLRIQQFPDDWIVCGKTTEKYRQIGNAVPAGLGHAVGSLVLKLLSGEQIKQIDGFKYSRYRNTSHAQTSVAQLEV